MKKPPHRCARMTVTSDGNGSGVAHSIRWLLLTLVLSGCGLTQLVAPSPTSTPVIFTPRYATAEEYAEVATAAAENCGKPYYGTFCGNPPRYVTPTPQ